MAQEQAKVHALEAQVQELKLRGSSDAESPVCMGAHLYVTVPSIYGWSVSAAAAAERVVCVAAERVVYGGSRVCVYGQQQQSIVCVASCLRHIKAAAHCGYSQTAVAFRLHQSKRRCSRRPNRQT